MEILLMITMIIMFILVCDKIAKKPVYRDSPADPNYINYNITTTLIFNEIDGICPEETITIQKIFYADNQLASDKIIDYISKNISELYFVELCNIENNYKNKYKSIPSLKTKIINVEKM